MKQTELDYIHQKTGPIKIPPPLPPLKRIPFHEQKRTAFSKLSKGTIFQSIEGDRYLKCNDTQSRIISIGKTPLRHSKYLVRCFPEMPCLVLGCTYDDDLDF